MEDVVSCYNNPVAFDSRPCIGEKRIMAEMDAENYLLPEKRPSNDAVSKLAAFKQQERGEKRSAKDLIPQEPSSQQPPREKTIGELEEEEIMKRISARVLALPLNDSNLRTCFHGVNEPGISFSHYVDRLIHYANVWAREKPSANSQGIRCAILAVEYLERANVRICARSVHRLFLIAFLLGIKLTDDFGMSNTFWSRAGGCSLEDVNRMEVEFCNLLKWDFGVPPEVYEVQKRKYVA